MTAPADITRERWMQLVKQAEADARTPHLAAPELLALATRLREARTPDAAPAKALCQSLRWACLWFAHSGPMERMTGSRTLLMLAEQLRAALTPPEPTPGAARAAASAGLPADLRPINCDDVDPAWLRRADTGRD